jgi:2-oxo-3-hexenedioate decarboxylase
MDQKTSPDHAAIVREILDATAARRSIPPFSARAGAFTDADATRIVPLTRAAFERRGERIVGRKIGFTNRTIWPEYGVYAPNWGWMTDRTVREPGANAVVRAADFVEPRLEPEIMFGFARAPSPGMDERTLLGCIEWIAFGYEIVQSIYPDWKFTRADTTAANALHGALLIGERHEVPPRTDAWTGELATFTATLSCNGAVRDVGGGANVLDSPLSALRHLVELLADDTLNAPLAAGDIVSTGTLTRALPVKAGETWTAAVNGLPLPPAAVTFV